MINFREFKDTMEIKEMAVDLDEYFEKENIEVLYEGGKSKAWVTAATFALHSKVNAIGSKIKNENDMGKKLDLLADQNRFIAAFINLSVAATMDDKGVYKKTK